MNATKKVELKVIDPSGGNQYPIRVPPDWKVEKLINGVREKLRLPATDTRGNPMAYGATLMRTNSILDPESAIEKAGVQDGDVIRLHTTQEGGDYDTQTTETC